MSARLRPPVASRDHALGNAAAPVTLVEYGDFECPFCGRAHAVVEALEARFGDRLRLVFRHFPISASHPHALLAAEAAEAAGAQGGFWPMHDTLYRHQRALELLDLIGYAEALGLDPTAFERDLLSHRFLDHVRADVRSGALSGVNGTPTFFVNGWRHDGNYDLDSLSDAIAGALGAELGL